MDRQSRDGGSKSVAGRFEAGGKGWAGFFVSGLEFSAWKRLREIACWEKAQASAVVRSFVSFGESLFGSCVVEFFVLLA